jgi:hypothetical protein
VQNTFTQLLLLSQLVVALLCGLEIERHDCLSATCAQMLLALDASLLHLPLCIETCPSIIGSVQSCQS